MTGSRVNRADVLTDGHECDMGIGAASRSKKLTITFDDEVYAGLTCANAAVPRGGS
jgi:hypothetical protein